MDWYPRYPVLWRTKTRHLDPFQEGCYLRLIDEYMETRQPLPDSDSALARIIGISIEQWLRDASGIIRHFFTPKNGLLFHDRCDQILNEQDAREKKQTEKSRKGAQARWNKNNNIDASGIHQAMPNHATGQDKTRHSDTKVSLSEPPTKEATDDKPKRSKPRTAYPSDWQPNGSHRAKCSSAGYDIARLAEQFKNYCLANGKVYADWDAAFHNWIGNASRFGDRAASQPAHGNRTQPAAVSILEAGRRAAARFES